MKKSLYFLMALAALAMSCNKVEEPKAPVEPVVEEGVPFSFCAGFVSKTVNDGLSTKWVAGDQVSLFNAAAGEAFAANGAFSIAEADLADNKFTGLLAAELTADAYDWAAVYPYAESNASLSALALEIGAPAVTVAADAKTLLAGETLPLFGKTAGVAKDEAVAIQLSHLAAAVKIAVKNPTAEAYTLNKVTVTFPEAVAGAFTVDVTGEAPAYTAADGASATVVITLAEETTIAAGATVNLYIPVKPYTAAADSKISYKINDEDAVEVAAVSPKLGVIKALNVNVPAPSAPFKVDLKQYGAEGNGETVVVPTGAKAEVESCPSWITITPGTSSAEFVFAANDDELNARLGKVILKNGTDNAVIYVAQAAKGCKCFYESFATGSLSDDWKASWEPSCADGYTQIQGGDGYVEHVTPLFYHGLQIRQKYNDSGSCNKFICTLDIKADGAEGGIIGFNTAGYNGTSYDLLTNQNYIAFASANAGETSGGYFCFHVNNDHNGFEANAMDSWTCDSVSEFFRIEMSNVERNGSGVGGDWGGKYVWTTEADANGVLQSKALVFSGGMWWWQDGVQLGKQYGYFGVFSKFGTATIKNFVLSYQDNQ